MRVITALLLLGKLDSLEQTQLFKSQKASD
jgi:hypothetical protein